MEYILWTCLHHGRKGCVSNKKGCPLKYVVYVIYIKVQFLDTTPQISTQACVYKLLQVPSAFDMRFLLRDVLCSDKTGTLTSEQTTLALEGEFDYTSHDVLKLAYANSYFQVYAQDLLRSQSTPFQ